MTNTLPVDYLLINGARYRVAMNQFARSQMVLEPGQVTGKRLQSPYIDAELVGFESGDGALTVNDNGTQTYSTFGFEPTVSSLATGHVPIKVGRQLTTAYTSGGAETGLFAIWQYSNNEIYQLALVGTNIYKWDGATSRASSWAATVNSPASARTKLVWFDGKLWWGLQNGRILSYDGTTFTDRGTMSASVSNASVIGVASGLLWASTQAGVLHSSPITAYAWTARSTVQGNAYSVGCTNGNTVYVSSQTQGNAEHEYCYVQSCSGDGSGSLTTLATIDDNYPLTMVAHGANVAMGMAWGGSVRLLSGSTLTEILHVGALVGGGSGAPGAEAIWALLSYDGVLYAAGYDSTAATGQRTWIRQYQRSGWLLTAYGGSDLGTSVRALARGKFTIYLGTAQSDTNAALLYLSTSSRLLSATLTAPRFVFGAPTARKQFVAVAITHSALVSGQAVQAKYAVDNGSTVTMGTNYRIGATETVFWVPSTGVAGYGLQPSWVLTNIVGSDLTVYSCRVRCLPSALGNEVWDATLLLHPGPNNKWYDTTADTRDATTKFNTLAALRVLNTPVQVVAPLYNASLPVAALTMQFDPQTPLQTQTAQRSDGIEITLPVKLIQARQPANLIANASFEQNSGSGTAPTSWSTDGTGTSANVLAPAQDGTYGLKLVFDGVSNMWGRLQVVSGLTPGNYYTLSGYLKRNSLTAGTMNLDVYEAVLLDYYAATLSTGTDSAYVRYSGTFQLPAGSSGSVYIRLFGASKPAGTVWFDAIQLEEGAPVSTFRELGTTG